MKKIPKLLLVLIILTLCFIWGNSLLSANLSGTVSGWVKDFINTIIGELGGTSMSGDGVLRKIAHASEFALLGIELTFLLLGRFKKHISLLFLCGLSVALLDETIQLFVNGRAGSVKDIWIDFAGYCVGATMFLLLKRVTRHKKETPK